MYRYVLPRCLYCWEKMVYLYKKSGAGLEHSCVRRRAPGRGTRPGPPIFIRSVLGPKSRSTTVRLPSPPSYWPAKGHTPHTFTKRPPEHAGTKTREDKTKGDTTRGNNRRRRQEKPRQEKTKATEASTRYDQIRPGDARQEETRWGEVYAPKRRCFPTRFHKRTKGLSDPRRPRPLEPSPTYFSCIRCTGPL